MRLYFLNVISILVFW